MFTATLHQTSRVRRFVLISAVCCQSFLMLSNADAALAQYHGFDRVTNPSIAGATNSLAAEANWLNDAALRGPIHTVDFESMTLGANAPSHIIAPGVRMWTRGGIYWNFQDTLAVDTAVANPNYALVNGFNTTAGGSQVMRFEQRTGTPWLHKVTFTFDQPVQALSLFITGEGNNGYAGLGDRYATKVYLDGNINWAMSFGDWGNPYWPSRAQPNARFGGFIDPTGSFTSVTIETRFPSSELDWNGGFCFDDVRWVYAVPAPGTLGLLASGGLLATRRTRRS